MFYQHAISVPIKLTCAGKDTLIQIKRATMKIYREVKTFFFIYRLIKIYKISLLKPC